jgi:hypothetical protein
MVDESRSQGKKIYESPRLTVISLRPEEAVLGHCKSLGSSGPVQASCHMVGGGGNCHGIGS